MTDSKDLAQSLFLNALEFPTEGERAAYVEAQCGGDPELRQEVEELLDHARRLGPFLEPGEETVDGADPISERPGTVIGPYKLLQQIGEGGMGVVFMAEQSEPLQRTVALKIIKPGMDTRQVIARFEAERQAVAMMDHPNIAKVLDAGTADSGRPYFVMELVKGIAITKYCDDKHLPLRARLEMFVQVCHAVQHAHQKGIIHRDIKPNNVLVAEYDHQPVPKVIDFGVAKATAHRLTERTMFTEFGQVLGTMEYMSPEQSKLNQLDVDTRSDVYSLGVLLYELLAGSTPFEGKRLKEAAFDEMLRIIREEEPPKPSTRLSTTDQLPSIAANRGSEPKKLSGLLQGELDWVVMKALEKDRNRRYDTASAFAADVGHYLQDEAVQACPPSAMYRFRKFARRNKGPLATAGLLAISLLAGLVLLAINNQRLKTEQARTRAEEERTHAEFERAQAELGRADGNLTVALQALDEVYLKEVERRGYSERKLSAADRAFLRKGLEFYEQFALQNSAHSGLQKEVAKADARLGYLWRELGQLREAEAAFDKAIPIFERLVAQSPEVAEYRRELASCLFGLSVVLRDTPRQREAEERARRAVSLWEAMAADASLNRDDRIHLGHVLWHLGTRDSTAGRYEEAERRFNTALALFQKLSADFPADQFYRQEIAFGHRWLATDVFRPMGRLDQASQHAGHAIAIYERLASESPDNNWYLTEWVYTLKLLAGLLTEANQPQQAEEVLRQVAGVENKLVEPFRHAVARRPGDPWAHQFLGEVLAHQGRFAEAEAAFREAIRLESNDAGRHQNLADVLRNQHKFADAALEYAQAAQLSSEPSGSYSGLGSVYAYIGQWDKAAAAFGEVAKLNPTDVWSWFRCGTLSLYVNDIEDYRGACGEMLDRFEQTNDPETADRVAKTCALAPGFGADAKRVMTLAERAISGTEAHPQRKWFEVSKGLIDYRAGRFGQAAEAMRIHAAPSDRPPRDAIASAILAMAQQRLGHPKAARTALAHAQQIIAAKMPKVEKGETFNDDWHDWLHAQILCREAEQLLKESAVSTQKS